MLNVILKTELPTTGPKDLNDWRLVQGCLFGRKDSDTKFLLTWVLQIELYIEFSWIQDHWGIIRPTFRESLCGITQKDCKGCHFNFNFIFTSTVLKCNGCLKRAYYNCSVLSKLKENMATKFLAQPYRHFLRAYEYLSTNSKSFHTSE